MEKGVIVGICDGELECCRGGREDLLAEVVVHGLKFSAINDLGDGFLGNGREATNNASFILLVRI